MGMLKRLFAAATILCIAGMGVGPATVSGEETPDFDALFEDAVPPMPAAAMPDTGIVAEQDRPLSIRGTQCVEYPIPVISGHEAYDSYLKTPKLLNALEMTYDGGPVKLVSNWDLDLLLVTEDGEVDGLDIRAKENYAAWNVQDFRFGFGYQNFKWGSADELNPTDNLNPKDYSRDIFAFENIPVLSLSTTTYLLKDLAVEGVWIPYDSPYAFPEDGAASIPEALFPSTAVRREALATDINAGALGFQAKYYSAVDVALSYVYDYDAYDTPVITYDNYMEKSLTLVRKRMHRIGMDFKTTVDRAALWLEACYSMTEDPNHKRDAVRNPDLAWTLGTDFTLGAEDRIYFNIQYTGRYVFDFDDRFYTDYPDGAFDPMQMNDRDYMLEYYYRLFTQNFGDQREALLHGLAFKGEWKLFDDKIVPSVAGAFYYSQQYDTAEKERLGSLMLNPEVLFKPVDGFEIRLGAELAYAWQRLPGQDAVSLDETDRLGRMHGDSNAYLEVKYIWGRVL